MLVDYDFRDFFPLIKAAGYRPSDFSLTPVEIPSEGGRPPARRRIVITRQSNGTKRAYLADDPIASLGRFVEDLKIGVYGAYTAAVSHHD